MIYDFQYDYGALRGSNKAHLSTKLHQFIPKPLDLSVGVLSIVIVEINLS